MEQIFVIIIVPDHLMSATLPQLEQQKDALLAGLDAWPVEQLQFLPTDGGWSAVQVVDHLVKTERGVQALVRRALAAPHRIGVRDRLGTLLLHRIFRSDRRVKVPSSADMVLPSESPHLPELRLLWNQSRAELARLLVEIPPAQQRLGLFRHSVGGWMSLAGVLDFFSVHMHHHEFQFERLRTLRRNGTQPRSG